MLDTADKDFASIRKIFDLSRGPNDFRNRKANATAARKQIEEIYESISRCNDCIQQMLPIDKRNDMIEQVN